MLVAEEPFEIPDLHSQRVAGACEHADARAHLEGARDAVVVEEEELFGAAGPRNQHQQYSSREPPCVSRLHHATPFRRVSVVLPAVSYGTSRAARQDLSYVQ